MFKKKATPKHADGQQASVSPEQYRAVVAVMEELSFRGKMQETLVMRIANAGGFSEVANTIKKRRLYSKKMGDSVALGDPGTPGPAPARRAKKKGKGKKRPTASPAGTDQPGEDTQEG